MIIVASQFGVLTIVASISNDVARDQSVLLDYEINKKLSEDDV